MRKLILICLLFLTYYSNAQQYTPSTLWGNSFERLAITQADTVGTKLAGSLTVIGGTLYIANGTKWSQVTGGGGSTDSLVYATLLRLYKVNDSMKVVYSNLYGFNIGNTNLRLTGNRSLSGGAGSGEGYEFTFDSTGKVIYQNKAGVKYFEASSDGSLILTGSNGFSTFQINNYGGLELATANEALDANVSRFEINSEQDTAIVKITNRAKLQLDKVNPNNGSSYKILVRNEGNKEVEYVDALNVDTVNRTTGYRSNSRAIGDSLVLSAAINAKPNFGDIRDISRDTADVLRAKILADSIALASATNTKEPIITPSLTPLRYWNGYKNFVPLNKDSIGLGNVPNVNATNMSNAASGTLPDARLSSNVTQNTASQTITNKTISSTSNDLIIPTDSTSISGTSYTLVLSNKGTMLAASNAGTITVTIPPNSTVAFPVGTVIMFQQLGVGKITLSPATNVNFRSAGGLLSTYQQHSVISIIKTNTNTWAVIGDRGI